MLLAIGIDKPCCIKKNPHKTVFNGIVFKDITPRIQEINKMHKDNCQAPVQTPKSRFLSPLK